MREKDPARRKSSLVFLAALGLFSGCGGADSKDVLARIKARGELRWGADAQGGAPYVFQEPGRPDSLVGFEKELADAIATKLGVRATFVQADYAMLLEVLARGDVIDVAINGIEAREDTKKVCDLSHLYYIAEERLAVRTADRWLPKSLEELKGKKAGTLPATLAAKLLDQAGANTKLYDTGLEAVYKDLTIKGPDGFRLDAVLIDEPTAIYYGKIDGVTILEKSFGEVKYAVAFPKEQQALHEAIDGILESLRADGTLARIYKKWGIWNPETAQLLAQPQGGGLEAWNDKGPRPFSERVREYPGYFWVLVSKGAPTTLGISLASFVLAVVLGMLLALSKRYGPWPLRWFATAYIEVFRGTPLLVQLYFIYFGLPDLGIPLNPLTAGILGLGLNYAAGEAENYRAGLESVPAGQIEAAWSLGLSTWQAIRFVIVPQAIRVAIPPATNDFIALLKDSSLVSAITMADLMLEARKLASTEREYQAIYGLCALVYLLMGLPFARLARYAEQRMGAYLRRAEQ